VSSWAIVAVKARAQSKQRLATTLDAAGRVELVRRMLDHVLATAAACRAIDRVVVVSPERDRVPPDVPVVADAGIGLNEALDVARNQARGSGAIEIVVLPADLPLLETADLETLIDAGRSSGVAIATDRTGVGTNGLYLPASLDFPFRFGTRSHVAHVAAARLLDVPYETVRSAGFAFDVDTPKDVRRLQTPRSAVPRWRWRWSWSSVEP
jgi:2-phospho-L-lactate guanylyltransferase